MSVSTRHQSDTPLAHAIWAWAVVAAMIYVGFWMQLALFIATRPSDPKQEYCARFLGKLACYTTDLMGLWDFRVHGAISPTIPEKTVVVANHVSQADPFLVARLPWHLKFLAKAELFRVPFFGALLRLAGHVPIRRGDHASARRAMERCADWIGKGVPVLIFPEGTRSDTGELTSFKDGAFRLAIEHGAAVLPVAIAGTRAALPKHSNRPGRARGLIAVGRLIPTTGMTMDDLETLKESARAQIGRLLGDMESSGRSHEMDAPLSDTPVGGA